MLKTLAQKHPAMSLLPSPEMLFLPPNGPSNTWTKTKIQTNKKRRTENSSGDTNKNHNTEWLVDKKQFFAFNKRLRSCPKLNGKEICCKLHVLGH